MSLGFCLTAWLGVPLNEDGNTAANALPEMKTAYLMMADVEPKDW